MTNTGSVASLVAGGALIALGWIALGGIYREGNSCRLALALCVLGMSIGLAIDAHAGRVAMLDALCIGGERSPLYWVELHWQQLPAMHAGMIATSLFRLPHRSLLGSLVCCAFMVAGMTLGSLAHTPASMLALMTAGMTWGAVARRLLLQVLSAHYLSPSVAAALMNRPISSDSCNRVG